MNGARARALLGVLIAYRGAHVPVARLISELWDSGPPASATTLVRGYVLAIRRAFGDDGARVVVGHARGYRLALPPGEIDACRFDEAARAGHDALRRDQPAEAVRLLTAALALYRGDALGDVPRTRRVGAYAAGLTERRLLAQEDRIEAELRCGRSVGVLADLRTLVAEHPGRERLIGLWMRALDASGRRSEALDTYRLTHRRLAEHTGIAPGPELTRLHEEILARDRPPVRPRDGWVVPGELPASVPDFTGRADEVVTCADALHEARVVTISGAPGVGKTALALRVAHALRPSFPDGQLYARLGGGDVLGAFLRATGVPAAAVPPGTDERAALFRSRTADRRVLVVLDDAADEAQVRALLPGGSGCGVLVTGPARLSGLEGARALDLDTLPPDDALALVARIAAGRDPEGLRELLGPCAGLPLALRIVAARIAAAPRTPLSWFARRLADDSTRLDELRLRDLDVRARLAVAWASLGAGERDALRALAAGAAVDHGDALRVLAERRLITESGVDPHGRQRYRIGPLIALFAREKDDAISAA